MKLGSAVLLAVAIGGLVSGPQGLSAAGQSHVRVHVTDAYGNSVPVRKMTMTLGGVTSSVPQDEVFSVTYGRYTLEVNVPGFSNAIQPVVIDQPDQIINVAMRMGVMEVPPPLCSIVGQVSPEGAGVRMRLMQLFGSYTADVPVTAGGLFEFRGLECGDYMLVVMGANECLGTKTARATPALPRLDVKIDGAKGNGCTSVK